MKPTALLVNTSRGAIVEEQALVDALRQARLGGAGLDVFGEEPVDPANPLLRLDNVVLTPHVVWYTRDTMRRYLDEAVGNVTTALKAAGMWDDTVLLFTTDNVRGGGRRRRARASRSRSTARGTSAEEGKATARSP
jgi:hypothetical protein